MIETVTNKNFQDILPLIKAYQLFYKVREPSDTKNAEFFSQFGPESNLGCQFIYRKNNIAVGFATVYFSFASSIAKKVGVMNDLYTLPDYRGEGVARALIDHCKDYALSKGAARLQWVTAIDNERAQKLYDAMNTKKSTWHFYSYQ